MHRDLERDSVGNTTWERNGDSDSQQRIWNVFGTRQRRERAKEERISNKTTERTATNPLWSHVVRYACAKLLTYDQPTVRWNLKRKGAGLIPTFSTTHTLMRVHLCERTWVVRWYILGDFRGSWVVKTCGR
jgi:hypothetical protein